MGRATQIIKLVQKKGFQERISPMQNWQPRQNDRNRTDSVPSKSKKIKDLTRISQHSDAA